MEKSAEISECGIYRYLLRREWEDGRCVCWIMFNPSTADANVNDHTIRKCIEFSRLWGYGALVVANLYAVRSRDPKRVALTTGRVGPLNDYWTLEAAKESREIIFAWGCGYHMPNDGRRSAVAKILAERKPPIMEWSCLGVGKDGNPKHPLILPYSTPRQAFRP